MEQNISGQSRQRAQAQGRLLIKACLTKASGYREAPSPQTKPSIYSQSMVLVIQMLRFKDKWDLTLVGVQALVGKTDTCLLDMENIANLQVQHPKLYRRRNRGQEWNALSKISQHACGRVTARTRCAISSHHLLLFFRLKCSSILTAQPKSAVLFRPSRGIDNISIIQFKKKLSRCYLFSGRRKLTRTGQRETRDRTTGGQKSGRGMVDHS